MKRPKKVKEKNMIMRAIKMKKVRKKKKKVMMIVVEMMNTFTKMKIYLIMKAVMLMVMLQILVLEKQPILKMTLIFQ